MIGGSFPYSGKRFSFYPKGSTQALSSSQPPIRWVKASWIMIAHAQKPDFVFRRNGRVHLNRRGRHFSRLLGAEVCASAVVMLDTPCSEVVWRVLATHSIRQFSLHFSSRAFTVCHQILTGVYHDFFPRVNWLEREPDHVNLLPILRMSGAVYMLFPYAIMERIWQFYS